MHTGEITKGLRPSWEPLVTLVGRDVVTCFMWVFALVLDDGSEVHAYKHVATRRYLHLAEDGRAFEYRDGNRYAEIEASAALHEVFSGWEEAIPQPRNPDAVRAQLERHRPPPSEPVGSPSWQASAGPAGPRSSEPAGSGSSEPTALASSKPAGSGSSEPTALTSSEPAGSGSSESAGSGSSEPVGSASSEPTG
jgi:hypothetical protein